MSSLLSTNYALSNLNHSVSVSTPKQIKFRGDSAYNTVESEEKSNKKKAILIPAAILTLSTLVFGGVCLRKGGKALEGKQATLKEKFQQGWKEIFRKSEKAAEEGKKAAEEGKKAAEEGKNVAEKGEKVTEESKKAAEENKNVTEEGKKTAKETKEIVNDVQETILTPSEEDYDKYLKNFTPEERKIVINDIRDLAQIGFSSSFKETSKGNILEITPSKTFVNKILDIENAACKAFDVPVEDSTNAREIIVNQLSCKFGCNSYNEMVGSGINGLNEKFVKIMGKS